MQIHPLIDPFALRHDGGNSPTANIDWGGYNLSNAGTITATTLTDGTAILTSGDWTGITALTVDSVTIGVYSGTSITALNGSSLISLYGSSTVNDGGQIDLGAKSGPAGGSIIMQYGRNAATNALDFFRLDHRISGSTDTILTISNLGVATYTGDWNITGNITVTKLILAIGSEIEDDGVGYTQWSGDGVVDGGLAIAIPQVAGSGFYYGYGGTEHHYFGATGGIELKDDGTATFGGLISADGGLAVTGNIAMNANAFIGYLAPAQITFKANEIEIGTTSALALNILGTTTLGDGGTTNYTQFSATGFQTMVGSAIPFEDLQFPVATGKVTPASGEPTWETFTTNTKEYAFDVLDYIDLQANELPHWYKEQSDGHLHVHFTIKTAQSTGSNRFAKFSAWVSYANREGTWTEQAVLSAEKTIPTGSGALQQFYLDLGNVTLTNYLINTQVKARIKRIASTGGTEYADDVYITQVGMHLQKDTLGSSAELTK